jgi:hypothetical protein
MISHTKVACEELLVMIPGEASILRHPAKRVSRALGMLSSLEVKVLCPT